MIKHLVNKKKNTLTLTKSFLIIVFTATILAYYIGFPVTGAYFVFNIESETYTVEFD